MIRALENLRGWRRAVVVFAAGLVTALPLPPLGLWPLLFAGVTTFLILLERAESRRAALGLGWLYGFGYFVLALHWIGNAFLVDAETYLWMMPFMVGGLAAGMAVYWGLAALAVHAMGLQGLRLALGFGAAIAIAEWLRGRLFTGFPWAAPGLAVDGMGALAQTASLIGMTGLTLVLMVAGGLPLVFLRPHSGAVRAVAILLAALLPLGWAWGAWRLAEAPEAETAGPTIRIVQPNIAQDQKWRMDNGRAIFDQLKAMSSAPSPEQPQGLAGVDYLIWPESAVPFLIDESSVAMDELARLLGGRTTLITGALRRGPPGEGGARNTFNSIIVFGGDGQPLSRYDKWRLVPGGEFLPFEWLLEPLGFRKVVTVPGSFEPGPGPVTLTLPGGLKAGLLVCYEVIFPHELIDGTNRPDVMINVTNDGWFGASTGPYQHFAQSRLRAIEQGMPLIRAANTGISAAVDGHGRVVRSLPLLTQGTIDLRQPPPLPVPIYGRFGDWALALLAIAALAAAHARRGQAP